MSYPSTNDSRNEPFVCFDYSLLDGQESVDLDAEFWMAEAELLGDLLRWMTIPHSLREVGARCYALSGRLNPAIMCDRKGIASVPGALSVGALSEVMREFESRYRARLHAGNSGLAETTTR